jgi:HSP20 family protein
MARSTRSDSSRDTTSRQTSRRPSTDNANIRGQSSSSNQTSQSAAPDRERSIETRDETGRTQGQTGTGLSRRQGTSPVYGSGVMNPFAAMRRWSEDMDRLFQDFGFGQLGFGASPFRELGALGNRIGSGQNDVSDWSPQVEAFRRGDKFVVRADLPGMKKDDVKVEVENNVLTISGERTDEHEENREGFYRSERSYGQFYRAIPLPEGVSADQCEATFKDGVLEVSLKAPQQREKSKQIPVR